MVATSSHFDFEVQQGERFQFGKNWSAFLSNLSVVQIKLAETSLREFLQVERLDGKSFLDVGSGSGLFSLAARRLGARVYSFDYDPQSVACTMELRRRYFPNDPNWTVQRGSVLDEEFLGKLGGFDVVYSWGVLHHTGSMWKAFENVKSLVPVGGQLFIAIYNDQGAITDRWASIKKRYNSLPGPLAHLFALTIIARHELKQLFGHYRSGTTREWLRTWREYHQISARGMSRWHDWIDWIGGYPYERATLEQVADVFARDGFRLTKIFDCSSGYGCNEFVFRRDASSGHYIDVKLPGGWSMAKRFGWRIAGPFELTPDGWAGKLPDAFRLPPGTIPYLLENDGLVGPAVLLPNSRAVVASASEPWERVNERASYVVAGHLRPLHPPFYQTRGNMWEASVPDLVSCADRIGDGRRSPVFVFEDGKQLAQPHALHDEIDKHGGGRFSHWGESIYFSSSDESHPNRGVHSYLLIAANEPAADYRSVAQLFGRAVAGPFQWTPAGWTGTVLGLDESACADARFLMRDDVLAGQVELDAAGRILVAPPDQSEEVVQRSSYAVVIAELHKLEPPFQHERGLMWRKSCQRFSKLADGIGRSDSPIFVFQNERQLPSPHAPHDHTAELGGGRFSHWEDNIYFSTIDGTDPNTAGREFVLLVPGQIPSS